VYCQLHPIGSGSGTGIHSVGESGWTNSGFAGCPGMNGKRGRTGWAPGIPGIGPPTASPVISSSLARHPRFNPDIGVTAAVARSMRYASPSSSVTRTPSPEAASSPTTPSTTSDHTAIIDTAGNRATNRPRS
jgi:hypothetical protein